MQPVASLEAGVYRATRWESEYACGPECRYLGVEPHSVDKQIPFFKCDVGSVFSESLRYSCALSSKNQASISRTLGLGLVWASPKQRDVVHMGWRENNIEVRMTDEFV